MRTRVARNECYCQNFCQHKSFLFTDRINFPKKADVYKSKSSHERACISGLLKLEVTMFRSILDLYQVEPVST